MTPPPQPARLYAPAHVILPQKGAMPLTFYQFLATSHPLKQGRYQQCTFTKYLGPDYKQQWSLRKYYGCFGHVGTLRHA